ncbi:MAG: pseudouridine synthase [Granulosicoccus sp.]|nr:pseudouridine synthase [Granulosicoccus sp.]
MKSGQTDSLILFNKPFGVLSQFTDADGRTTLAEFIKSPDYYPAGRLDKDSEGLLLLTNDGRLQQRISDPTFKLPKIYLAQVDGDISQKALAELSRGVVLKDGPARAGRVEKIDQPDWLWPRTPPIRYRKHIPTSWITLSLTEGRNRQVRRMTAAVGYPTLRLIRTQIGNQCILGLPAGEFRSVPTESVFGATQT